MANGGKAYSAEEIAEITEMSKAGYTVRQIADRLGRSYDSVISTMILRNIPRSSTYKHKRTLIEEALYIDNKPRESVAASWGMTVEELDAYVAKGNPARYKMPHVKRKAKTRYNELNSYMDDMFKECAVCHRQCRVYGTDYAYKYVDSNNHVFYFCSWTHTKQWKGEHVKTRKFNHNLY